MQDINIEKLTKRAIAIYTQERTALLEGSANALQEAESLKEKLIFDLEAAENAIAAAKDSPAAAENREQLSSLYTIIERRISENIVLAKANSRQLPSNSNA